MHKPGTMSCYTLSQRIHVAKKEHRDNGFNEVRDWVHNSWQFEQLPKDQQEIILSLVHAPDAHLILPGERYEYSFTVGDGDKWIFKTKERFAQIINKFKIYHED
jgi:hypothetical protein